MHHQCIALKNASLKGLRVYRADGDMPPVKVPPPSPRKYRTRRGVAEWLTERLAEDVPTLVGIDHGFSFPLRYFEVHRLQPDWSAFLDDFQRHWPTDENSGFAPEDRTGDQHDAYSIAAWLRRADHDGSLAAFLAPLLTPSERAVGQL
jgi:hypothetical protein